MKDATVQSLEFMSRAFERFRVSADKELKRLSAKLEELAVELEFQDYELSVQC